MAFTRPTGEQINFRSVNTGTHLLDTYLENCELGGRTLYDLLGDVFDANGNPDPNIFAFRVEVATQKLQVRVGTNATAPWIDVPEGTFFKPTGNFQVGAVYQNHDLFSYNDNLYIVSEPHTAGAAPDLTKVMLAISGGNSIVPASNVDIAGNYNAFIRLNNTASAYEITPFADSNVFYGLNTSGNELEITTVGKDKVLSDSSLVQSLYNYANGITDPLVTDGFWDLTYSAPKAPPAPSIVYSFIYGDVNQDDNFSSLPGFAYATPDLDDVQELANILQNQPAHVYDKGNTSFPTDYYYFWLNTIKPHIIANQSTYENMLIPLGTGTVPLFQEVQSSQAQSFDIDDYDEYMLSNGNLNLSVTGNNLVVNIL